MKNSGRKNLFWFFNRGLRFKCAAIMLTGFIILTSAGGLNRTSATTPKAVLLNIPFTSQAPLGHWNDPRQEDGCEEASSLMAMVWINHKRLVPLEAEKAIIAISQYELAHYGNYHNTSVKDTVKRILAGYFNYNKAGVKLIKSIEEIKKELIKGNAVIIPVDGRKLHNPNYKQPGPERHTLLIKGYDYQTDEFIANDSGTRRGNNYRYKSIIIWQAIRDYITGDKIPIKSTVKNIIIVRPN